MTYWLIKSEDLHVGLQFYHLQNPIKKWVFLVKVVQFGRSIQQIVSMFRPKKDLHSQFHILTFFKVKRSQKSSMEAILNVIFLQETVERQLVSANLRFSIHWSTYICKFWCFYPEVHANFLICPTIVDIFRCLKMVPSTSRPLCSQKITHSDPSPSFPIVRSQLVIVHSCPRVHGTNYYK